MFDLGQGYYNIGFRLLAVPGRWIHSST
jgi:hypothetical protein